MGRVESVWFISRVPQPDTSLPVHTATQPVCEWLISWLWSRQLLLVSASYREETSGCCSGIKNKKKKICESYCWHPETDRPSTSLTLLDCSVKTSFLTWLTSLCLPALCKEGNRLLNDGSDVHVTLSWFRKHRGLIFRDRQQVIVINKSWNGSRAGNEMTARQWYDDK